MAGKSLVEWAIAAAIGAAGLDRIVVSSNDSRVLALSESYPNVSFLSRQPELSDDQARNIDVLRDIGAIVDEDYDYFVLLQPTSPLRTSEDIDAALSSCAASDAHCSVSVSQLDKSSYWLLDEREGRLHPALERASGVDIRTAGPALYLPNGAVYVIRRQALEAGIEFFTEPPAMYEMPRERSIDVDDEFDFVQAEALMRARIDSQSRMAK